MKPKIMKVLYVEPGVDEKGGARMLEQSTEETNYSCAFTVVPNAFVALECSEYTCYDLIIAKKDMQHLGATDMLNVLHAVGSPTPVVLLLDEHDDSFDHDAKSLGFFSVLRKPLSTRVLCNLIETIMNRYSDTNLLPPAAAIRTQTSSSSLCSRSDVFSSESASSRSSTLIASDTCDFKRLQTTKSTKSNVEVLKTLPEKTSATAKQKNISISSSRLNIPEGATEIQERSRPGRGEGEGSSKYTENIPTVAETHRGILSSSAALIGPSQSTRLKAGPAMASNEFSCLDEELLQMEGIRASPCSRGKNPLSPSGSSSGSRASRHVQVFPAESRHHASEIMQHHNSKYPRSLSQGQEFESNFEHNQIQSNIGARVLYSPARDSFLEPTRNHPSSDGYAYEANTIAAFSQQTIQKKAYEHASESIYREDVSNPTRQSMPDTVPAGTTSSRSQVQQSTAWDPKQAAEQLVKEWSSAKGRGPSSTTNPGSTLYPSLKSINTALLAVESNGRISGVAANHHFLRTNPTGSSTSTGTSTSMSMSTSIGTGTAASSGAGKDPLGSQLLFVDVARQPRGSTGHPLLFLDPNCESTTSSGLPTPSPSPSMFHYSALSGVPPPPLPALSVATAPRAASPYSSFTLLSPAVPMPGSTVVHRHYPFIRNALVPVPVLTRRPVVEESVQTGRHPNPNPNPSAPRSEFGRKRAPTDQGGYDTFSEK